MTRSAPPDSPHQVTFPRPANDDWPSVVPVPPPRQTQGKSHIRPSKGRSAQALSLAIWIGVIEIAMIVWLLRIWLG